MSDGQGVVRAVSWRDLCPWLIIFRSFALALRGSVLLAATIAVLLTPLGWLLADLAFVSQETKKEDASFAKNVEHLTHWPAPRRGHFRDSSSGGDGVVLDAPNSPGDFLGGMLGTSSLPAQAFHDISLPFRALFSTDLNIQQTAFYLFGALWTLAIWSFFGGVITRMAAVEFGREERATLKEAVVFAGKKYLAYFIAPLSPLAVVLLILALSSLVGLLMRGDAGLPFAAVLWPLVLVGAFVSAVVLLGLALGWPLMWATVSTEGTDAFDALSRGYAYTFQRPLHYLFYAIVAVVFGALCWALVSLFTHSVVGLAYWATGWGAGNERVLEIGGYVAGDAESSGMQWFGASLIAAFNSLVYSIATGFAFAFFWSAATAIYLLLRYDVDQTEFDEVHMEDEEVRYGLPPLIKDEAGVPAVPPEAKTTTETANSADASAE